MAREVARRRARCPARCARRRTKAFAVVLAEVLALALACLTSAKTLAAEGAAIAAPPTTAPAAPLEPALPDPTAIPPTPPSEPPVPESGRWGVAPLRTSGRLALEYRDIRVDGSAPRRQFVELANVNMASYVWQPWFAQVQGGLGFVLSQDSGGDLRTGNDGRVTGDSRSVTGNGSLSVFPASRFPFLLTYDQSDSRASADLIGTDYASRRLGARQSYRTLDGDISTSLSFDRSILESRAWGVDRVDVLNATASRTWSTQRVELTANHAENVRSSDDQGSTARRFSALHTMRPADGLSLDTLASTASTRLRIANGQGGSTQATTDFRQMNSFGTWRPEPDHPLYLTGAVRLLDSSVGIDDAETSQNRTASGTVSAIWRHTKNLSSFGNTSATRFSNGPIDGRTSNVGGGLTYVTDPVLLGKYVWSGNGSLRYSRQTGAVSAVDPAATPLDTTAATRNLVVEQAGHTVMRSIPTSQSTMWMLNVGQNVAAAQDSFAGESHQVSHTGSVSWRITRPEGFLAYAALSGADSRTYGANANTFQLVNVQLSGQQQLSQNASGNANLTYQTVRQETPNQPSGGFTHNLSGGASFQHQRAFGVPRLRYSLIFNAYNQQVYARVLGEIDAPRERITWSLEQRLEYLIGRLDVRFTARVAEIDGRKNALFFIRVGRQFGAL